MVTVDHVIATECVTDADGNCFLTDAEMRRRAHLLLLVALGQYFFG